MIERWITALHSELDLTADEIADVTWLGLIRHRAASRDQEEQQPSVERGEIEERVSDGEPAPPLTELPQTSSEEGQRRQTGSQPHGQGIFPRQQQKASKAAATTGAANLPIKVINAPALREPLTFIKALRPLIRQVPTRWDAGLDEKATAQKIADERVWIPVTKPMVEPWLELALVIDESASMLIWRRTVLELRRMLKHYGAFRDVRTWGLIAVKGTETNPGVQPKQHVYIRSEFGATTVRQTLRRPEELIDPNGRRLVLVVTDCVSELWHQGAMLPSLKTWADNGPMAIVQMLPEWMWVRTALRQSAAVQLSGLEPGLSNQRLSVWRSPLLEESATSTHLKEIRTPVFTLEPEPASLWCQMVAGKGNIRAPGVAFRTDLQPILEQIEQRRQSRQSRQSTEPTSEQKVQRFKVASTPVARRLAGLIAATPVISQPVIRLIQEILLPESRQVHVAEVLLGGLLTATESPEAGIRPDDVQYRFLDPQMRSILLDDAPVTDTTVVLSSYVTRHLGRASLDVFIAELRAWMRGEGKPDGENLQPFAIVTAEVLKRRGGDYADFIEEVERRYPQINKPVLPAPDPVFPELETLEFETAQLVQLVAATSDLTFPPLQTQEVEVVTIALDDRQDTAAFNVDWQLIAFEVATLERNAEQQHGGLFGLFQRDEQRSQWVIRKQRQQRVGLWVEPLGDGVELEMLLLPGGTFVMGSPEDEPERTTAESPQHEVRLDSLMMGRYPVTQAQWRVVAAMRQINRELKPNPSRFKGDKRPVEQVTWFEAVEFCDRLSAHTGRPYRLPSEAEWEYACRAGTTTPFHVGETLTTDLANYDGTSIYNDGPQGTNRKETTLVDQFGVANAFGLCDMHGNVREWCQDHWHKNYEGAPSDGSAWLSENENAPRLRRGGSWFSNPRRCRSAYRNDASPDYRTINIGFRVVCSAP